MYAQNNIDKIILDIFGNDKFFVESGGSHPIDQNNSYLLEQHGWKGLIVEPKKDFNDLYSSIRKNTIVENFALVSENFPNNTIQGDFRKYMEGSIINHHSDPNWELQEVPCTTLNNLFKKHNIKEVHFLSLDVEGYETEVIEGINFNDVFIHSVVVETHTINGFRPSFDYLSNFGYKKFKTLDQHDFFIKNNSKYYKNI